MDAVHTTITPAIFMQKLAGEFAQDLTQVERLKAWTTNSDILGAHAEAAVRQFVRRTISPLRCLNGTVVWEARCEPEHVMPQYDGMLVWTGPAPTLFETEDFALVPRDSCVGILEIKRSTYSGASEKIHKNSDSLGNMFENLNKAVPSGEPPARYLGVFCLQEQTGWKKAEELIDKNLAVCLMHKDEQDKYEPNPEGIWTLIKFLIRIRDLALRTMHDPNVGLLANTQTVVAPAASGTAAIQTNHPH